MTPGLPIVQIHDTDFYVDLRHQEFSQVDVPFNTISFDEVDDGEKYCTILYDTATKNVFRGSWEEFKQSSTTVEVRLPCLAKLDPATMMALIAEVKPPQQDAAQALKILQQSNRLRNNSPKRHSKKR